MTWGTNFRTDVFLSHQNFSSKYEVNDKIGELDYKIENCVSQIKMYVASTPADIIPEENENTPIDWLNDVISDLFDSYREYLIERHNLYSYLEYLNHIENDGGLEQSVKNMLLEFYDNMKANPDSPMSAENFTPERDEIVDKTIFKIINKLNNE